MAKKIPCDEKVSDPWVKNAGSRGSEVDDVVFTVRIDNSNFLQFCKGFPYVIYRNFI
jgi:hypothetical protein